MKELLFFFIVFVIGYMLGKESAKRIFDNQIWTMLKWNQDIFGYRIIPSGAKIHKQDKLLMAIEFDSVLVPDGGLTISEEDEE